MRKTLCASVLVLVLCGSAFAGDMGTPPIAPGDIPNPPSAPQTTDGTTDTSAAAATADITSDDNAGDLAAAALSVINSVLALL